MISTTKPRKNHSGYIYFGTENLFRNPRLNGAFLNIFSKTTISIFDNCFKLVRYGKQVNSYYLLCLRHLNVQYLGVAYF